MVESTQHRISRIARLGLLVAQCGLVLMPGLAAAQSLDKEQKSYPVSEFFFEYALEDPALPTAAELGEIEVELRPTPTGFVPPSPNAPPTRFALSAVPPDSRFHPGALRTVNRTIVESLTRRGIGAVLVTLPDLDEESGEDLRPAGETRLRVQIWTGRVEGVSTLADGERYEKLGIAERTNLPRHAWIREGSPVQPGGPDALLRPRKIKDYAARLSRHPGRRVQPVLRPGEIPGAARLEYHVAEQKPWLAYAQLSNTGTSATTIRRERFGFAHNQLTGRDDALRFDYMTGDFDSVHGVWGEYGGPIWNVPRMRWRIDGSWNQYDASEVGVSELDFKGEQWHAGGRLSVNLFQYRELFVDAFSGLRWLSVNANNSTTGNETDHFFLPAVGLSAERVGEVWSFDLEANLEHNFGSLAGSNQNITGTNNPSQDEFERLGRPNATTNFTILSWRGEATFYPFPLLGRMAWQEESDLGSYDFAHELAFMVIGQNSLGDRLIPQLQQIVGGLYTVRGYKQSAAAGDDTYIASAEYRLHLPRLLDPAGDPPTIPMLGTFRLRPENAFAYPDWDFILRAFVDYGYAIAHDQTFGESNQTLHSFGVGAELKLLRYVSARLDLGFPQRRLEDNDPSLNKPQIHGVVTVLY